MKVLVVGGGGREHALVWKISRSPLVDEVIIAPGNAGTRREARCVEIPVDDIRGQVELAKKEAVDLVIVGPEAPLVAGIADRLATEGIRVFGPSAAAARLEGSKVFAKEFMQRHGVPTASFSVHEDLISAIAEVDRRQGPCVVKADGLAAGKGVVVCRSAYEARDAVREMIQERRFGDAGSRIIIEDCLEGEEASVLAICDGKDVVPLVAAQDYKPAYEGDTGPNTGGMGAYAPTPIVTPKINEEVVKKVLEATVSGMAAEGTPFVGVLYAGIMISEGEPYVLEFNVRFGDPECQPLMVLMKEDLIPLLVSAAEGQLVQRDLEWHEGATLCVVLAAEGYPGSYTKGKTILNIDKAEAHRGVTVFHSGTKEQSGRTVTNGGRVLGVTALAGNLKAAIKATYSAANEIQFEGMRMRRDIGHRAL